MPTPPVFSRAGDEANDEPLAYDLQVLDTYNALTAASSFVSESLASPKSSVVFGL